LFAGLRQLHGAELVLMRGPDQVELVSVEVLAQGMSFEEG